MNSLYFDLKKMKKKEKSFSAWKDLKNVTYFLASCF